MTRGISKRDSAPVVVRETHITSGDRPAVHYIETLKSEGADAEHAGFSATCQNTSLADWVQLIQMGRRDAVIIVRTPDHGEGRLWCKAGDIIDARWGPLTGEDAVYRILSFEIGDVTVDFDMFERPRVIHTSTSGLLLQAAYQKDSVFSEPGALSALAPAPNSAAEGNSTAPQIKPRSLLPEHGRTLKIRLLFSGSAVAAALVVAFWLSSRAGSDASPTARAVPGALAPAAAPIEDFVLHVEAQPEHTEIRLDGTLVATRALDTRLPRDGRLHEVLVSAPGYVSELVTFRDQATIERIALTPIATEPARARFEDTATKARRTQVVRRAPEPAPEETVSPATGGFPPARVTTPAPKPRIQVIDERQPQIQAIDEEQPRIEGIE
jgi:hypothetical protein